VRATSQAGLQLEWAYGHNGSDATAPNAFFNSQVRSSQMGVCYEKGVQGYLGQAIAPGSPCAPMPPTAMAPDR
jgi:hypothetical protein